MSTDANVTQDLIQTLEDGKDGYDKAAAKLADSDAPELAEQFRQYSAQREGYVAELRSLAAEYGDQVDSSGSAAAALHRGWLTLKDALSGSGVDSIVSAAVQGEEHAIKEFTKAVEDPDVSPGLRTVAQRQLDGIKAACGQIQSLSEGRS